MESRGGKSESNVSLGRHSSTKCAGTATAWKKPAFKFLFLIPSPSPLTFAMLYYQPRVRCGRVRKSFWGNNKCYLEVGSMPLEVIKLFLTFSKSSYRVKDMHMEHGLFIIVWY